MSTRKGMYTKEKPQKNRFLAFVVVLLFFCLVCAFAFNYLLYCRVQSLSRQIEELQLERIDTEQN